MTHGRRRARPHRTSLLLVALASLPGCERPVAQPVDLDSVRADVEALVWTFHAADTAMDAQAIAGLLWPDYEMLVDGQRLSYEEVAQGSHDFMSNLRSFHMVWSDLRVIPLSADLAVSSFLFRDSIVTADGQLIQGRGPTTLLWERRHGEWRMRFGDADHYPITAPPGAG